MSKKPGISFERHQEIGAQLREIMEMLTKLSTEFANAYPYTGTLGKPLDKLREASNAVNGARSDAEQNYFAEHGDKAQNHTYSPFVDTGGCPPGDSE